MRRNRAGAHAVEFAFVAPILLLLTFGGMDYAWYFMACQELRTVAQQAARVGAQTSIDGDPQAAAVAYVSTASQDGIVLPGSTIAANATLVAGPSLEVVLTAQFSPILGMVPVPTTLRAGSLRVMEVD